MMQFAPTHVVRCPHPPPHDYKDILARTITSLQVLHRSGYSSYGLGDTKFSSTAMLQVKNPLFCFEPIYDNPGLYLCTVGWPSNQAPNQKHDVIAWLKCDQQSP